MKTRITKTKSQSHVEEIKKAKEFVKNALSSLAKQNLAVAFQEIDNALGKAADYAERNSELARLFNEISTKLSSTNLTSLQKSIALLSRAAELTEDSEIKFKVILQLNLVSDYLSLLPLLPETESKEEAKRKAREAATKALHFSKEIRNLNPIKNWRHKHFHEIGDIDLAVILVIRDFDLSDTKRRLELIFDLAKNKRWLLLEGLLNNRANEIDINGNLETNGESLIDYALNDNQTVLVKYLLLLGAIYKASYDVMKPYFKIFNIASIILNPDNAFFRHLPTELKQLMLLSALREEDADLKRIPDQILLNISQFELDKKYKEEGHHVTRKQLLEKLALFSVRSYRDDYPYPLKKSIAKDKQRMLSEILEKKYSSQPLTRSLYNRLNKRLSTLASADQYLTKTNAEKIIDDILLLEQRIAEMVATAFSQFSVGTSFFTLEKNCLYETLSLVLAESYSDIEWSQTASNQFIQHLVDLLENKMEQFKINKESKVHDPKYHFMCFSKNSYKVLAIDETDIHKMMNSFLKKSENPVNEVIEDSRKSLLLP